MDDFKNAFASYLTQKHSSQNTIGSYLSDLDKFSAYLALENVSDLSRVDEPFVVRYMDYLKSCGFSTATVTRNLASIRSFCDFLVENGTLAENPAKSIKAQKVPKKIPEILSSEEMTKLLSTPDITDPKGCRDKAMLELLYATGIRVSELISLNIRDVNLGRGLLYCRGAKAERTIPIYPAAISAVSDYLYRVRGLLVREDSGDALFTNLNGTRLTRQGFWKIIKAYAKEAKIEKEITPHTFRHAFALHMLQNGADLKDIKALMGHSDISSTQVYLQMLDHHVEDVYRQYHPMAKNN